MHLSDLKSKHVSELLDIALELDVDNASRLRKQELMFAILKKRAKAGEQIFGDGTLEILPDGFGFLRSPVSSYLASTEDIYISPSQIRRFNLHTGDTVEGEVRIPKDGERYFALVKVDKVNGLPPEALKHRILFENLTPLFPNQPLKLERNISGDENLTGRLIDILAPIGKGQRALLVASPKSGKTVLMQHIAHAITANYPDVILMVLLIDERPEEVTEMERSVKGEVIASTFDEPATRHVQVAEMVIEKAKRLAESKKDVVILLDSITRRRDFPRLDHPSGPRLQHCRPDFRQSAHRRRGLQRPAAPETHSRCSPQSGRRRLAHDHRHCSGRNRQPYGRCDL